MLSCYDRIVVTGTLPRACYAEGMTAFVKAQGVRIFDYPRFAEPLRDALRARAQELATSAGLTIEHISKAHIRKEDVVAKALERRGDHPGLVHVISAMEACDSYRPWRDKASGQTFLKPDTGKCLHYYFYFIDREVGLCYLARADMVSLPAAVLLQRTRLAGAATHWRRHRLYPCRQCLCADR